MYSEFPAVVDGKKKMIRTSGKYVTVKIGGKTRPLHRVIMEQHLGRKLDRFEVVHHKDGNKSNNNIDNLEIMPLHKHSKMHMYKGRKLPESTIEKLVEHGREKRPGCTNDIETVKEIKKRIADGESNISIARDLKKSRFYVSKIKTGYRWSWIDKPNTKNDRKK